MRRWLPRFWLAGSWMGSPFDDVEDAEGWSLGLRWGGLQIELQFGTAARNRRLVRQWVEEQQR